MQKYRVLILTANRAFPVLCVALPVLGIGIAAACGELPPAPVTPEAVRIRILPGCETVAACGRCTLQVVGIDKNSRETLPPNLTWTSSDESIALVSSGTITGVSPGPVIIRASSGDGTMTAERSVTVLPNMGCP